MATHGWASDFEEGGVGAGELETHLGGADNLDRLDLLHREIAGGRPGIRILQMLDIRLDR